ncbi:MAG: MmgE/PrpD family protein [Alphaproteobacteria bacterium]|nr:MmgE/PrpD family protein [Alphaproteobacteria bacterium]
MRPDGLAALGQFAASLDATRLPAPVIDKAKSCLLYGLAVGVAGMASRQAAQAATAIDRVAAGGATCFYDDRATLPALAAFANGALFHARVQDDAHPAGHAGVVVLPAALAVAEARNASGTDLIAALVAGYEVALRIGRDHAADASARGFRTTPIYGVFGAAAAASRLEGLDEVAMTNALGLAANMAGGLREFAETGSEDFPFHAGSAASNGISAMKLAASGANASTSALDGPAGFYRAYGAEGRRYGRDLAHDLGHHFEIMVVTYKPYPICQFHRGVVRGAASLARQAGSASLASLRVRMHPFEADFFGVRFAGPFASFPQTFMSVPFCAALAWARGTASYAGLIDFAAGDVRALVPRIAVIAEPGRERYAPALEARLDDGRILAWEERERAGAYDLTWRAARDMTEQLMVEVGLPPSHGATLIAAVSQIDDAASVAPLADAMRAAGRAARAAAD